MEYLHWNEQTITDFSPENVAAQYALGYVFTRIGKGVMHQTRSCRVDLSKFELSSENRRILKKTADVSVVSESLPYKAYDFSIGKLAKDFYDTKFAPGIMSAQKIKEMLTDADKSNFNEVLVYSMSGKPAGYTICYENDLMVHYSYPFYDLTLAPKDMGMGMMLKLIDWAKNNKIKFVYLGSLQRPSDTYKFQFAGFEWFDGDKWRTDTDSLKEILK